MSSTEDRIAAGAAARVALDRGNPEVGVEADERGPLIVGAIRRNPDGELRYQPTNGAKTGTSGRSFLAEYDAVPRSQPAPRTVSAAEESAAFAVVRHHVGNVYQAENVLAGVLSALGIEVTR